MKIPTDRKYLATHEWFKPEGDLLVVGISQFAADELTDITFVDLPAVGTKVQAGKAFGEIESVKATAELISAVSGAVAEINAALADAPELVNGDPFHKAWMVKIKPGDRSGLDALMDAAAYESHCAAGAH
ncbi:MAG: glycine cleavage system protein GcvH [Phycisphaerales bacterium]|nr:glycine cleavage system protein GcvH [Phycisphaerales bacterium]